MEEMAFFELLYLAIAHGQSVQILGVFGAVSYVLILQVRLQLAFEFVAKVCIKYARFFID